MPVFRLLLLLSLALAGYGQTRAQAPAVQEKAAAKAKAGAHPAEARSLFDSAMLYHRRRDFSKSIATLERLIVLEPDRAAAHIMLGLDLFQAGRAREALEPLKRGIALDPASVEGLFYLGLCYLSMDREDEARKVFDRLAAKAPSEADQTYLLMKGLSRMSTAMLGRLSALGQDSARMHQVRAEYYEMQDDPDHAIQELEEAIRERPDLSSLHYAVGVVYWKKSEPQRAKAALTRAIELDPRHFMARLRLGMVLLELNEEASAAVQFRAALTEEPGLNLAYLGLGKALYKQGAMEAAVPQLQRYIELTPDDPAPHYILSQIYRRLEKSDQAQRELAIFKAKTSQTKEGQSEVK